jgi:hypothetical protein
MLVAAGAEERRRTTIGLAHRRYQAAACGPRDTARLLRNAYRERADRNGASYSPHRFTIAGFGLPPRSGPRRAKSGMGDCPRSRIRGRNSRSRFADRLRVCKPSGARAAAGHRICGAELSPGKRNPGRRGRADAPDTHGFQVRPESDRDFDAAQGSVRKTPWRLPGFRACDDRRTARARTAGGLCQRLSAHHPAARQTAPARCGRDPRMGLAVVWITSCSR